MNCPRCGGHAIGDDGAFVWCEECAYEFPSSRKPDLSSRCLVCQLPFAPRHGRQKLCSPECASVRKRAQTAGYMRRLDRQRKGKGRFVRIWLPEYVIAHIDRWKEQHCYPSRREAVQELLQRSLR